jgi:hypothetical protein
MAIKPINPAVTYIDDRMDWSGEVLEPVAVSDSTTGNWFWAGQAR